MGPSVTSFKFKRHVNTFNIHIFLIIDEHIVHYRSMCLSLIFTIVDFFLLINAKCVYCARNMYFLFFVVVIYFALKASNRKLYRIKQMDGKVKVEPRGIEPCDLPVHSHYN